MLIKSRRLGHRFDVLARGNRTVRACFFLLTCLPALGGCGPERDTAAEVPKADSVPRADSAKVAKLLEPEARATLTGRELRDELRGGGYVLYFRHFNTDHTRWHEDPIKPKHAEMTVRDFRESCDQQRPLTAFGRRRAKDIGGFLKRLRIPVGKVLSSPYCRAVESATLLAGREPDETPFELVHLGGGISYEMMAKNVRPLLGEVPKPRTNTIIVAHRPQMDDTRFIEEGECFVLKPLGNGRFSLVGTIYDSDWYEAAFNIDYLGLRGQQPGGDVLPRGVSR